jgi:hypothetical protein
MLKYLIILILLWLLTRQLMRFFFSPRRSRRGPRPPHADPKSDSRKGGDLRDFTQQEISDAEFEDLDDKRE